MHGDVTNEAAVNMLLCAAQTGMIIVNILEQKHTISKFAGVQKKQNFIMWYDFTFKAYVSRKENPTSKEKRKYVTI